MDAEMQNPPNLDTSINLTKAIKRKIQLNDWCISKGWPENVLIVMNITQQNFHY